MDQGGPAVEKDNLSCPICLTTIFTPNTQIVCIQCGHLCHEECYDRLVAFQKTKSKLCTVCRKKIKQVFTLPSNILIANQQLLIQLPSETAQVLFQQIAGFDIPKAIPPTIQLPQELVDSIIARISSVIIKAQTRHTQETIECEMRKVIDRLQEVKLTNSTQINQLEVALQRVIKGKEPEKQQTTDIDSIRGELDEIKRTIQVIRSTTLRPILVPPTTLSSESRKLLVSEILTSLREEEEKRQGFISHWFSKHPKATAATISTIASVTTGAAFITAYRYRLIPPLIEPAKLTEALSPALIKIPIEKGWFR